MDVAASQQYLPSRCGNNLHARTKRRLDSLPGPSGQHKLSQYCQYQGMVLPMEGTSGCHFVTTPKLPMLLLLLFENWCDSRPRSAQEKGSQNDPLTQDRDERRGKRKGERGSRLISVNSKGRDDSATVGQIEVHIGCRQPGARVALLDLSLQTASELHEY